MNWEDQLTRRWWQEPATFNVMTHLSKNYHDSISAWGFPPVPSWWWSATTGYLLLAACLLRLVTYGVWPKLQQHLFSDNVPICPSVCGTGNLTTAHQFGQWKSCAQALTFSNLWLGMWMMIAKAHMRGLWEACRCCCCILFTRYVSPSFHFRFTLIPSYLFTQLGISRRSMCIGACYAGTASWCDLRDPGWGDPGFRHCDFFAWHLPVIFNMCGFELLLQGWPAQDRAHKLPGHYVSSLLLDIVNFYQIEYFSSKNIFFCLN